MPNKGHRTASRQAKLSQKKRKGRGGSAQIFDAGPSAPQAPTAVVEPTGESTMASERQPAPFPSTPRQARVSRSRAAVDFTPMVYRYLGRELRQIGVISTFIVAVLVALTFALGG